MIGQEVHITSKMMILMENEIKFNRVLENMITQSARISIILNLLEIQGKSKDTDSCLR